MIINHLVQNRNTGGKDYDIFKYYFLHDNNLSILCIIRAGKVLINI